MNNLDRDISLDPGLPVKPNDTSSLKTITVFIGVLIVHVIVIGAFAFWWHSSQKGNATEITAADRNDNKPAAAPTPTDTPSAPVASTTDPAPATSTVTTSTTTNTAPAPTAANPVIMPSSSATASAPSSSTPAEESTPASAAAPSPDLAGGTTPTSLYTVKPGDSLARIARHNHTTTAKLKATNNLATDSLRVGQKLQLPGVTTLSKASPALSMAPATPEGTTTAPSTAPETAASSSSNSPEGGRTYTVKSGDTLHKIAHHFKISLAALIAANNITNPTKLSIGTKLKIPPKSNTASNKNNGTPPAAKPQGQGGSAPLARFVSSSTP